MDPKDYRRRLAAIFVADVAGYSSLMRDNEMETVKTLNLYRKLMTDLIHQHHGRVVDSPGDNLLAEFASVVDSVQAASAIQKELKERNLKLPMSRRMEFRIGINLGDIIAEENRIYGDGVNIAARLESLAEPGGIIVSRTAYDQIEDKLPLGYEYIGEKSLKNISRPVPAYRVVVGPVDFREKVRRWTTDRTPKGEMFGEAGSSGTDRAAPVSSKKRFLLVCICLIAGVFGAHRFYAGRPQTAKLMLFTIGGLGIWYIVDLLIVIFGEFSDGEGKIISEWF